MKYFIGIVAVLVLLLTGVYISNRSPGIITGSISGSGDAYTSTSTNSTVDSDAAASGQRFKVLKTGQGILGSVVITNETAGSFNLYDATTTNHGGYATSSALINVRASLAEGTYTLDTAFSRGLLMEYSSTNVASSTITWK